MGLCLRIAVMLLLGVAALPLLSLAARSLVASARSLRLLWRVAFARRAAFTGLRAGPVALRGRVVAIDPIVSPETGRRGVYLAYSADRWSRSSTIGGLSGQWLRAEQDEEAAHFELTDGETSVLVDPGAARILRVPEVTLEVPQANGAVVRYHEAMIEDGAELLVVGVAQAQGGFEPSAAYRGHGYRMMITDGGRGELTLAPPRGIKAALAAGAVGRLLGLLPAAAVVSLLAALFLRWWLG